MEEDIELELFNLKAGFFREIPHPKLIQKAIRQAEVHCGIRPVSDLAVYSLQEQTLEQNLKHYLDLLGQLKLRIAQAMSFEVIYSELIRLESLQISLIHLLASYVSEEWLAQYPDIRQSSPLDAHALRRLLLDHGLPENQIKDYLCQRALAKASDLLLLACLQCLKIVLHGRASKSS